MGFTKSGTNNSFLPKNIYFSIFMAAILDLPSWIHHLGSAILDPPSWICHLGSAILDPPSWICHLGSTILTPSLTYPTGSNYAKWFQTKHKGGHVTASYATLSMGDCLRETPFAAIQLCLSTTTILLFHRLPIYN